MILPWRNSASEIIANLSIPSFDELLKIFVFGFWSRIIVSNKLFTSNIYNSTCRIYSYMWTWWDNLVYMFPNKMLISLDFYYVTLHVTVIYLFHNTCIIIL